MKLNDQLSWKTLIVGGLFLDIIARILMPQYELFSFIGVLGDIMILLGIVNWFSHIKIKSLRRINLLFPFSKNKEFLEGKWWHRLFKVFYIFIMLIFSFISYTLIPSTIEVNSSNININNDLRTFTKSNKDIGTNTVPYFKSLKGTMGCLENGEVRNIYPSDLDDNTAYCNANIPSHVDQYAIILLEQYKKDNYLKDPYTTEDIQKTKDKVTEALSKETEKRYCFVSENINCTSDRIISYNKSQLYYLQTIMYPLIVIYVFSLILQLFYFKGLIYIIYGGKRA